MDLNRLLEEGEEPEKVWLITYSDMVTLLLAVFVVIASVSQIDESNFEEIQEALKRSVTKTKQTTPLKNIRMKLDEVVLKEKLGYQVFVKPDPHGLIIEFRSNFFFDIGDDALLGPGQRMLDALARNLSEAAVSGYTIAVEGHTDNVPISSDRFRSNWELSTSRATSVIRHLGDLGIPKDRLMASGFADTRPKVPNDTPEHRAANRRVVIKVIR